MNTFVKIVVYVPVSHASPIREVLAKNGCGKLGAYDSCSFSVKGMGRFRPLSGSSPAIGEVGKLEEVEEERIETICPHAAMKAVIAAVKKAHPYEEPVIDVYELINPL